MEAQLLLQMKEARKALLMVAKADLAPVLKYKPDPVYIPAANVTWSTAQRFIASYPTTFLHGVRCGSDCTGIFETGTHCDLNLNVELQVELEASFASHLLRDRGTRLSPSKLQVEAQ